MPCVVGLLRSRLWPRAATLESFDMRDLKEAKALLDELNA
jgi:hypothetical protein